MCMINELMEALKENGLPGRTLTLKDRSGRKRQATIDSRYSVSDSQFSWGFSPAGVPRSVNFRIT